MKVVTRFAPSPTGFLHIGGARTAYYNYLFARHHGGQYLLRIEDTDRARSTDEAVAAIFDGLNWLGLGGDQPPVFQAKGLARHSQVAHQLLEKGAAYKCYATAEELAQMREDAKKQGLPVNYDGRWRAREAGPAEAGKPFTIRIKMPRGGGHTTIHDLVQGEVKIADAQMDDFILLRSDGTPTYMLSVVVDDYDMGITHVIRGDDHLTNAFRQYHLYKAMGWTPPEFAHIPLIHGPDGAKLSKRHGALGVDAYRDMGYVPAALKNYLLRLGWSHGDDEIISDQQAIDWFDLAHVGRSAARFDFVKLESLNAHYIRALPADQLWQQMAGFLPDTAKAAEDKIIKGLPSLAQRASTLTGLAEACALYYQRPDYAKASEKALKKLAEGVAILPLLMAALETINSWQADDIDGALKTFVEAQNIGFGKVGLPLRVALTGAEQSPPLGEMMAILGADEVKARCEAALSFIANQ